MKVSVVVNVRDREATINRTLHSIINQTYQDLEIIVVDNGSADRTIEIVSSWADPRIKLFQVNLALGSARSFAVQRCTGDYIAFCDSDDWWLPRKLEIQIGFIEKKDLDCSCSDFLLAQNGSPLLPRRKYLGRPSEIVSYDQAIRDYNIGLLTFIGKARYVKPAADLVSQRGHTCAWDMALVLETLKKCERFGFQEAVLAYNTIGPGTLTSDASEVAQRDSISVYAETLESEDLEFLTKCYVTYLLSFDGQGPFVSKFFLSFLGAFYGGIKILKRRVRLYQGYANNLIERAKRKIESREMIALYCSDLTKAESMLPAYPDNILIQCASQSDQLYTALIDFFSLSPIFNPKEFVEYGEHRIYYAYEKNSGIVHATVVFDQLINSPLAVHRSKFCSNAGGNFSYLSTGYTLESYRRLPISSMVLKYILADLRRRGVNKCANLVSSSTANALPYFNKLGFIIF